MFDAVVLTNKAIEKNHARMSVGNILKFTYFVEPIGLTLNDNNNTGRDVNRRTNQPFTKSKKKLNSV